jgi:hypothetical protein
MNLFPEGAENVEEYRPKVHYLISSGGAVLCNTRNPREGTEEEDKVTCLVCLKRLEQTDEIVERGNIALVYNVSVDSPKIPQNGKKLLQTWLASIPDNVKLTFNHDYSKGNSLTASWTTKKEVLNEHTGKENEN